MKQKIAVLQWALNAIKSKPGIEVVVAKINQVWIDVNEPYPLPVGEYRRYSWLVLDIERMLSQLRNAMIELDRSMGRPVDEEGNDTREWSGNSIKADHIEALMNNAIFDANVKLVASCNDPQWWMDCVDVAVLKSTVNNALVKKVSKASEGFAERCGMAVRQLEEIVMIIKDGKVLFTLIAGVNGYSFGKNRHLPQHVKEELPGYYAGESSLREMIDYVSNELTLN